MARVLIAGAGKLGLPLAISLASEGHDVHAIRRSRAPVDHPGIQWHHVDLRQAADLDSLGQHFDQVIIILTPAERSPEGYRQIYQGALGNLFDRLDRAEQRPACLFVSATSVYAQDDGSWVDESSPTEPTTYNGRSLLEAETAVRQWSPDPLIVRFAGIYGPQRTRLLNQLQKPLEIQRSPPTYTNRVHQDDCVGILRFLGERQRHGRNEHVVYIGADHDPAEKYGMMSWLAAAAGLPQPIALDAPAGSPANKRCSNRRLLAAGYRFLYPDFRSGYLSLLQSLQPAPVQ